MQNESQNIEYKESWGRGFKKIVEEFERASLPLPTIEENGGGVMAIVQRKTIDEVIAERGGDFGVNVGDMSETNVGDFVGDFENDRKRFGGNAKSRHIRHEGSDKTGVWVILEHGNTNS